MEQLDSASTYKPDYRTIKLGRKKPEAATGELGVGGIEPAGLAAPWEACYGRATRGVAL